MGKHCQSSPICLLLLLSLVNALDYNNVTKTEISEISESKTEPMIDTTVATTSMAGSQSKFTTLTEPKTTEMPTKHLSRNPSLKNSTKTRIVLTINPQINTKRARLLSKKAGRLLYQEFGPDGALTTSFQMKNLDDVATFFKVYYKTEICNVKCEDPN